jgi:hypothetical protein
MHRHLCNQVQITEQLHISPFPLQPWELYGNHKPVAPKKTAAFHKAAIRPPASYKHTYLLHFDISTPT